MALILQNQSLALQAYAVLVAQQPGYTALNDHLVFIQNKGIPAYSAQLNSIFVNTPTETLAATMITNLGLTGIVSQAEAFAYLNSSPNRVEAMINLSNTLYTYAGTDSAIIAARDAYKTSIDTSYAYSIVTTNTASVSLTPGAGTTFTLTTGVDNFTGTSGNDTFIADNTQTNKVASVADVLNGGAGTDTLTVYGELATTPQISNIENIVLDNFADGKIGNFASTTGVTSVNLKNAVAAATVSVNNGVAVTIENNTLAAGKNLTVNYGATDTSANLTLNKVSIATGDKLVVTGTKVATLNIATTGTASSIGTLDGDAALTKVVVTGDKDLTIIDALEVTVATVDASALTGKLSVKSTNNAATQDAATAGVDTTDLTIKGGSGIDTINIAANAADNEVSVDAGAGDDKVVIKTAIAYAAATSTNAGDSIVGGAGTDTLSVDGDLAAADMSGAISGFEILEFTVSATGTNMATNKLGISQFRSTGAGVDMVLTGLAANATATLADDGNDLAATIGTDTAADVLNVVLESTGTTTGSVIAATNYETLNINSTKLATDAATAANKLAGVTASSATKVTLTGATNLDGGTITAKAAATIDASAYTGDLTNTTFGASVKSYLGGTGKDEITLVAGDLKQGNTFAGGAGTDKLTVTASASQDMGIIGLTGFETLNLKTSGANVGDFRNVTDLATINVTATAGTDDLTLTRLSADTTVKFGATIDQVVTTLNAGTTQKVAFGGNFAVASLTLDSGTTGLTVTSDDGNATANEAGGSFTALSGTSLSSITVLGNDKLSLGTLSATVTSVDASGAKGALTVTASATATSIIGSQVADALTGGAGNDTIEGGKGDDTISGAGGHDTIVFASTGALNGNDSLTVIFGAGASADVLSFKNFLSGGAVDQNGGSGTAITAYASSATADVNIANKVVVLADATGGGAVTAVDSAAEIAALIQGAGNVFSLTSGGKAVVIAGESTGTNAGSYVYMVNDALDGVNGTVSTTDVVLVGTVGANLDIDTLLTSNFAFA